MEFIPADDEKGPGLRFEAQGEREAGQAGREAKQISLSVRPYSTNSSLRFGKPAVGWRRPNGPSIVRRSGVFRVARFTGTLSLPLEAKDWLAPYLRRSFC